MSRHKFNMKRLVFLLFLFCAFQVQGQTLDPNFGNGGIANTLFANSTNVSAGGTLTRSDGKIYLIGSVLQNNGQRDISIALFNSNGTVDNTFGNNGQVILNVFGDEDLRGNVLQPDGKILICGFDVNFGGAFVTRCLPNGNLDLSFDNDGVVLLSNTGIGGIELQPDGKILTGSSQGYYAPYILYRFNVNGSPDLSFGTNGQVVIQTPSTSVKLQSDGKLIANGVTAYPHGSYINKYNSNGTVDNTFGSVFYHPSNYDHVFYTKTQPDGKIIAWGHSMVGGLPSSFLMKLNADGSYDNTFDNDGVLLIDAYNGTTSDLIIGCYLEANNKIRIVMSADRTQDGYSNTIVMRQYNPNATLDYAFGNNGVATIYAPQSAWNYSAMQSDGSIIISGSGNGSTQPNIAYVAKILQSPNVSIGDDLKPEIVSIYPNPTTSELIINSLNELQYIEIRNLLGQTLMNFTDCRSENMVVDVTKLVNGIYLLSAVSKQGDRYSMKFVKK